MAKQTPLTLSLSLLGLLLVVSTLSVGFNLQQCRSQRSKTQIAFSCPLSGSSSNSAFVWQFTDLPDGWFAKKDKVFAPLDGVVDGDLYGVRVSVVQPQTNQIVLKRTLLFSFQNGRLSNIAETDFNLGMDTFTTTISGGQGIQGNANVNSGSNVNPGFITSSSSSSNTNTNTDSTGGVGGLVGNLFGAKSGLLGGILGPITNIYGSLFNGLLGGLGGGLGGGGNGGFLGLGNLFGLGGGGGSGGSGGGLLNGWANLFGGAGGRRLLFFDLFGLGSGLFGNLFGGLFGGFGGHGDSSSANQFSSSGSGRASGGASGSISSSGSISGTSSSSGAILANPVGGLLNGITGIGGGAGLGNLGGGILGLKFNILNNLLSPFTGGFSGNSNGQSSSSFSSSSSSLSSSSSNNNNFGNQLSNIKFTNLRNQGNTFNNGVSNGNSNFNSNTNSNINFDQVFNTVNTGIRNRRVPNRDQINIIVQTRDINKIKQVIDNLCQEGQLDCNDVAPILQQIQAQLRNNANLFRFGDVNRKNTINAFNEQLKILRSEKGTNQDDATIRQLLTKAQSRKRSLQKIQKNAQTQIQKLQQEIITLRKSGKITATVQKQIDSLNAQINKYLTTIRKSLNEYTRVSLQIRNYNLRLSTRKTGVKRNVDDQINSLQVAVRGINNQSDQVLGKFRPFNENFDTLMRPIQKNRFRCSKLNANNNADRIKLIPSSNSGSKTIKTKTTSSSSSSSSVNVPVLDINSNIPFSSGSSFNINTNTNINRGDISTGATLDGQDQVQGDLAVDVDQNEFDGYVKGIYGDSATVAVQQGDGQDSAAQDELVTDLWHTKGRRVMPIDIFSDDWATRYGVPYSTVLLLSNNYQDYAKDFDCDGGKDDQVYSGFVEDIDRNVIVVSGKDGEKYYVELNGCTQFESARGRPRANIGDNIYFKGKRHGGDNDKRLYKASHATCY